MASVQQTSTVSCYGLAAGLLSIVHCVNAVLTSYNPVILNTPMFDINPGPGPIDRTTFLKVELQALYLQDYSEAYLFGRLYTHQNSFSRP